MRDWWNQHVRIRFNWVIERIEHYFYLYFYIVAFSNIPGLFDEFANNLERALSIALYYDHHDLSTQKSITNKIKQFYFNNELTREKEMNVTNVIYFEIDCTISVQTERAI